MGGISYASAVVDYYANTDEQKQDIQVVLPGYWKISQSELETTLKRTNTGLTGSSAERMSANT